MAEESLFGKLDENGAEIPDPVPMAPPIGYKKQPSMFDIMRKMIFDERRKAELEAQGFETPEEADDFDTGEDDDLPRSRYEHNFDHVGDPVELKRLRDAIDIRERELRAVDRRTASSFGGGATAGTRDPGGEPASSGHGQPPGPGGGRGGEPPPSSSSAR